MDELTPARGLLTQETGGCPRAGILCDGRVIDAVAAAAGTDLPGAENAQSWRSVRAVLAQGPAALAALCETAAGLVAEGHGTAIGDVVLGPPVPDPDKIICVGLNYREHADEVGMAPTGTPVLFAKFRNALVGASAPIRLPGVSVEIDYEGELAVVIGRRCHALGREDALEALAGYTILNDVSARDLQIATGQWLPGKALDTFAPCGPVLVPASEVGDPQALQLTTTLNDAVVQRASTGQMIFSVVDILVYVSSLMTLEPGDIIATGTPAGVGFQRQPPLFMKAGDRVQVAIEGLGVLPNPVTAP
jgi:2-keto-4-pentenoate hydratase/2-oxohepta-3-ene-1,7-dioic acid hydratase in catechol pathway